MVQQHEIHPYYCVANTIVTPCEVIRCLIQKLYPCLPVSEPLSIPPSVNMNLTILGVPAVEFNHTLLPWLIGLGMMALGLIHSMACL